MPEHLHILLTPGDETTIEKAMQMIKGGSAHQDRAREAAGISNLASQAFTIVGSGMRKNIGAANVHRAESCEAKLAKAEEYALSSATGKYGSILAATRGQG